MKNIFLLLSVIVPSISLAMPAMAQNMNNEASGARIEKLERDIMLLQRQVARGGGTSSPGAAGGGNADFEIRLSTIEEQLREILGKAEENDFQIRKLNQDLERLQKDTDFRFNDLTHTSPAAAPSTGASGKEVLDKPKNLADEGQRKEFSQDRNAKSVGKTIDPTDNNDSSMEDDANQTDFSSARDHYNYAFRLLNQTQYDKAASSFAEFTKKYPKDALIGNAYYWQGETYYIRRDYVSAADSFRQGFEAMPSGPKAPDNLLKLAMTLNALKRDKEACVVLGQVVAKFKKTASAVSQKAEQEQKRIDCK